MGSKRLREEFAKNGVEATCPQDEAARAMTIQLIRELQLGKVEGAADLLGRIAKTSSNDSSRARPTVCLACTELPLAFPAHKMLATFEYDGVMYVNSTAAHIDAAFDLAVKD